MTDDCDLSWKDKLIEPDNLLRKIKPGMKIFLSTGVAEPRTLVKHMVESGLGNLSDLELIQLISLGEAVCVNEQCLLKYRLKTFFSGWVASEAITAGHVDLIPCQFSVVPELIASGAIAVDAAFVQVTAPDDMGYVSLGTSVDAARQAMDQAGLVVGEINRRTPRTMGDTLVHVNEFNYFIDSTETPIFIPRWPFDDVFDQLAKNVAALIEDGDTICYSFGPLYEALVPYLARKRHLGIHGMFVTDAVMDLVVSGAVTNRRKGIYRGKCLTSYAFGTEKLIQWLDGNSLVEFQGIDVVADARTIGANDHFMAIIPARKVDLFGNVALHIGKGNVSASVGVAQELMTGARFSREGRTIFALPSRNRKGESNIRLSIKDYPNQLAVSESLDFVITEYGAAHMTGRTVRERALALIDIAHPDQRQGLVEKAKNASILYPDQIYLTDSGRYYPRELEITETFNDLTVRFRPIKPSDEDEMRRLFYRFSREAVYYRYFSPIKAMPHNRMQEYVNVDYRRKMSIVGLVGEAGGGHIIAEARYVLLSDDGFFADTAFVVDEAYQGKGVATFLLNYLIRIAKSRGMKGVVADVLPDNRAMWKVFEKTPYKLKAQREPDAFHLILDFREKKDGSPAG